ncbi:hypothetical protein ANN_12885 [Periplaneta americana]|uniref:Uncharacterized protein n=1 Tax=Periplaneta americana TaxID=6978 RepID=A0ABQ8TJU9_PERAM|nr:hypothetical protein ANN_12885 [Periplaneta americana]
MDVTWINGSNVVDINWCSVNGVPHRPTNTMLSAATSHPTHCPIVKIHLLAYNVHELDNSEEENQNTNEVKRRIAMAKEAFNTSGPPEKELKKRLVTCFVWSAALYGVKTGHYDELKRDVELCMEESIKCCSVEKLEESQHLLIMKKYIESKIREKIAKIKNKMKELLNESKVTELISKLNFDRHDRLEFKIQLRVEKLLSTGADDGGTIIAFIVTLFRIGILVECFCQKDKAEVEDKFSPCTIAAYVDVSSAETSMAEKCFSSPEVKTEEIFSGIANVGSKF